MLGSMTCAYFQHLPAMYECLYNLSVCLVTVSYSFHATYHQQYQQFYTILIKVVFSFAFFQTTMLESDGISGSVQGSDELRVMGP